MLLIEGQISNKKKIFMPTQSVVELANAHDGETIRLLLIGDNV
jgi:hypothetical protein